MDVLVDDMHGLVEVVLEDLGHAVGFVDHGFDAGEGGGG